MRVGGIQGTMERERGELGRKGGRDGQTKDG